MPRLLYAEAAISTCTAGARTGWIATVAIRRPSWHSLSQTHKNRWRTSHAWAVVRDHLYAARARLTSATAVRAAAREVRSGPCEQKKRTGTGLVHRSVAMRLIHIESISIAASCTSWITTQAHARSGAHAHALHLRMQRVQLLLLICAGDGGAA